MSQSPKVRGLAIALLVIVVGLVLQLSIVLFSGGAIGLTQLSIGLLAAAPLVGAVAGALWLFRRLRS
jgi:hypothetical protein